MIGGQALNFVQSIVLISKVPWTPETSRARYKVNKDECKLLKLTYPDPAYCFSISSGPLFLEFPWCPAESLVSQQYKFLQKSGKYAFHV